jgi:hypothetical protein
LRFIVRIEEFSTLPSAKLTVDEFREIWFQNAADPPAFAATRSGASAEQEEEEELQTEETSHVAGSTSNPSLRTDDIEAEAQSDFLESLVADRALEDEINRHLEDEDFQQALNLTERTHLFDHLSLTIRGTKQTC